MRTASLIRAARSEFSNSMLFDNGDAIQGTPLADYQAIANPIKCDQTLAVYKVMNATKYDAAGIGNHEFNFGLPYLAQVTGSKFNVDGLPAVADQQQCAGPNFPQILANVVSNRDQQPLFKPYVILDKVVSATDPNGKTVSATIKVGVIGFTPPTITSWDSRWLNGKVSTVGIKETAEKYIPEMRAKGADIVVAISHGGLDNSPYTPSMEDGNYYLSQVAGIDAMLIGHVHQIFPNASSTVPQFQLPGVDKVAGLVNGVPTVMANYWGKHLGVIQLALTYNGTHWVVDKTKTVVQTRGTTTLDANKAATTVAADPTIAPIIEAEHQATIAYMKTPVGRTDFEMSSFFADLGDPTAIQIVNQAQTEYVSNVVKTNFPQLANLPVLSVSAPFKSGRGGAHDYTDVPAGNLVLSNTADLYYFANTITAVKISGADLHAWLEKSAYRFNQINPTLTTDQALINPNSYGYNFDTFTSKDISYEIDVTQPLGARIKNLTYLGAAVADSQQFIVATNNYRASGGGNFPGLDGSKTIYSSEDANRAVLAAYVKAQKSNLSLSSNGSDRSWHFTKVATLGNVTYTAPQGKLALASSVGMRNLSVLSSDPLTGLTIYKVDLNMVDLTRVSLTKQ
ncbi:5'-nucleotidase/2'3'-cyclic phosphodiesterase and related esterase [Solimicrobium silvestre]|uniref:5'-nucleotidase/2'3'-cyclic phosphodiesterase and related esterase n=1 Tax=Solimicrobium silvestre TaxID=2099400 RepID=A0A2S9GXP7_9BURK|nr:5'-nucleotidase/2'3'-cyclic phosphodiesterase and related esterase [Solimicrobium silvestre]